MIAVFQTGFAFWEMFWETLEEAECVWAKQMRPEDQMNFAETIESMLLTSIPAEPMSRLRDVWSSLHLEQPLSDDEYEVPWWNMCCLLKGPDQFTDEEAKGLITELWANQNSEAKTTNPVSQDALDAAPDLLRWLKYTALCTVWGFFNAWSCYTTSLPHEVTQKLRDELFSLAMLVLFQQLR